MYTLKPVVHRVNYCITYEVKVFESGKLSPTRAKLLEELFLSLLSCKIVVLKTVGFMDGAITRRKSYSNAGQ